MLPPHPNCFDSLAIRLWSKDLKHIIPRPGRPWLQSQHRCGCLGKYFHSYLLHTTEGKGRGIRKSPNLHDVIYEWSIGYLKSPADLYLVQALVGVWPFNDRLELEPATLRTPLPQHLDLRPQSQYLTGITPQDLLIRCQVQKELLRPDGFRV